ncbi:hypothetical protein E2C01_063367 [Portunus trituberculatus]|uniref:Uncharacterized protein n=1 Tax=Portunus trituberculatus TaxID=210409 RepID=A0A5B7HDH4_PORTR|nr:hypothetical protein [Portunus trituberculatus]
MEPGHTHLYSPAGPPVSVDKSPRCGQPERQGGSPVHWAKFSYVALSGMKKVEDYFPWPLLQRRKVTRHGRTILTHPPPPLATLLQPSSPHLAQLHLHPLHLSLPNSILPLPTSSDHPLLFGFIPPRLI